MDRKGQIALAFFFIAAFVVILVFFIFDDKIPFVQKKLLFTNTLKAICIPLKDGSYSFERINYKNYFKDFIHGYVWDVSALPNPRVIQSPICPDRGYEIELYPGQSSTQKVEAVMVLPPPKKIDLSNTDLKQIAKLEYDYVEGFGSPTGYYGVPVQKSKISEGILNQGYRFISWEEIEPSSPLYKKQYLILTQDQLVHVYIWAKSESYFQTAKRDLAAMVSDFYLDKSLIGSRKSVLSF